MKSTPQFNGKILSPSPREPLFLIDDSLSRDVARALRFVGYNFTSVFDAFDSRPRVLDPEIIDWAKDHDAVWVHADDKAKKKHRAQILSAGIRTLWIYRRQGKMSSRDQLRILSYVLANLLEQYSKYPSRLHYAASSHGLPHQPRIRLRLFDL